MHAAQKKKVLMVSNLMTKNFFCIFLFSNKNYKLPGKFAFAHNLNQSIKRNHAKTILTERAIKPP